MTYREKRFCSEYLICNKNGAEAARVSGYSENSARQIASDLLTLPNIQAEIARLEEERARDIQQEFKDVSGKARDVLEQMLIDPETPATVRARVAQTLLDYGGYKPEEKIKGSLSFFEEFRKQKQQEKKGE